MEKINLNDFVKQYFEGKKTTTEENYDYMFFRNILDMKIPFFVKLRIFAKFFEEDHKRRGTKDFSFWNATEAIYDILSEEKFL